MSNFTEVVVGVVVELVLIAIVLGVLYRIWGGVLKLPRRQSVQAFQRAVLHCDGRVERVLGPGSHWVSSKKSVFLCDVRPSPFEVPAQELLSADGVAVRVSLAGEYRIVDPACFVTESSDFFGTVYLEVRQALRTAVSDVTASEFSSSEAVIITRIKELVVPRAALLGIEITQLGAWEAISVGRFHQ